MSRQAESCDPVQTHLPEEAQAGAPAGADAGADAPAAGAGPAAGAWVALPDPEGSGDSYYWNQTTGETTWEVPAGFVADTANTTSSAPARETESEIERETVREVAEAEAETADSALSEPTRTGSDSSSAAAHPPGDGDDAPDEVKRALWCSPRAICVCVCVCVCACVCVCGIDTLILYIFA